MPMMYWSKSHLSSCNKRRNGDSFSKMSPFSPKILLALFSRKPLPFLTPGAAITDPDQLIHKRGKVAEFPVNRLLQICCVLSCFFTQNLRSLYDGPSSQLFEQVPERTHRKNAKQRYNPALFWVLSVSF